MHDEWRELITEAMEREAEQIMEEVNADPAIRDVQAPKEIHDKLFEQIREYEKQKIYDQLTEEDQELIRLGKIHKKQQKVFRYVAVVAVLVGVLMVGNVSMGEGKIIPKVISRLFAGREQTVTGFGEAELNIYNKEDEMFEKIEKTYGFIPVRLMYLPKDTIFYEGTLCSGAQGINLIYEMDNRSSIVYIIWPDYRNGSIGTDIEDKRIQEFNMTINDVEVTVEQYVIEQSGQCKWSARFVYEDVLYMLRVTGIKQEEMEKIVNNLHFFK